MDPYVFNILWCTKFSSHWYFLCIDFTEEEGYFKKGFGNCKKYFYGFNFLQWNLFVA